MFRTAKDTTRLCGKRTGWSSDAEPHPERPVPASPVVDTDDIAGRYIHVVSTLSRRDSGVARRNGLEAPGY